jgi:hypothetical protein
MARGASCPECHGAQVREGGLAEPEPRARALGIPRTSIRKGLEGGRHNGGPPIETLFRPPSRARSLQVDRFGAKPVVDAEGEERRPGDQEQSVSEIQLATRLP